MPLYIGAGFSNVLTTEEILNKAAEYRLLSYNILYDINRLFKSQQKEIDSIISEIEEISQTQDVNREFERIYLKISFPASGCSTASPCFIHLLPAKSSTGVKSTSGSTLAAETGAIVAKAVVIITSASNVESIFFINVLSFVVYRKYSASHCGTS